MPFGECIDDIEAMFVDMRFAIFDKRWSEANYINSKLQFELCAGLNYFLEMQKMGMDIWAVNSVLTIKDGLEQAGNLIRVGVVDKTGQLIPRHQGKIGEVIKIKNLPTIR